MVSFHTYKNCRAGPIGSPRPSPVSTNLSGMLYKHVSNDSEASDVHQTRRAVRNMDRYSRTDVKFWIQSDQNQEVSVGLTPPSPARSPENEGGSVLRDLPESDDVIFLEIQISQQNGADTLTNRGVSTTKLSRHCYRMRRHL